MKCSSTFQSALQPVKPVAGQVEVRGLAGIVNVRQVGTHSARIAALVHELQAALARQCHRRPAAMYAKRIQLTNFGPIEELDIEFPFDGHVPKPTVLVGQNGSARASSWLTL